jgi:hypothetical protein
MFKRHKKNIFTISSIFAFGLILVILLVIERKGGKLLSERENDLSTAIYSTSTQKRSQHTSPNILHVAHFSHGFKRDVDPSASNPMPVFEKTINNSVVVQKLYNVIIALPEKQSNVRLCTFNPKIDTNELYFFYGNNLILHATIEVGGCGSGVSIEGMEREHILDDAFFSLLAKSLGVKKHELIEGGRLEEE